MNPKAEKRGGKKGRKRGKKGETSRFILVACPALLLEEVRTLCEFNLMDQTQFTLAAVRNLLDYMETQHKAFMRDTRTPPTPSEELESPTLPETYTKVYLPSDLWPSEQQDDALEAAEDEMDSSGFSDKS